MKYLLNSVKFVHYSLSNFSLEVWNSLRHKSGNKLIMSASSAHRIKKVFIDDVEIDYYQLPGSASLFSHPAMNISLLLSSFLRALLVGYTRRAGKVES